MLRIKKISATWIILMIFVSLCVSCDSNNGGKSGDGDELSPQLLIYCGITMASPIMKIANVIEQEKKCTIKVIYGGSLHLKKIIETNNQGDIYFPGNDSFLTSLVENGTVIDTVQVGYNKAVIMVRKGNPKHITHDLNNFTDPQYAVVIGAPESSSIGRETKRIFTAAGIYEQVLANALYLTTDSKGISKAIRNQDADLAINWRATAFFEENRPLIDVIDIDEQYAQKRNLVLGLLKYSNHKGIARRFMEYAASPSGQEIFRRYGFVD